MIIPLGRWPGERRLRPKGVPFFRLHVLESVAILEFGVGIYELDILKVLSFSVSIRI